MIRVVCLDDSNRPNVIPEEKWVKAGEIYHVIFVTFIMPGYIPAFQLMELDLDESCYPFEYFRYNRFVILDNTEKMNELSKDSFNIAEAIREIDDALYSIIDGNGNTEVSDITYREAKTIIELLNDIGDNPPYYCKKIY